MIVFNDYMMVMDITQHTKYTGNEYKHDGVITFALQLCRSDEKV